MLPEDASPEDAIGMIQQRGFSRIRTKGDQALFGGVTLIALSMSVTYYLVAGRWPLLRQRPVLCGIGYGLLLYVAMSVLRWRREIGVLRALGVTRGGILSLFLFEGAFFGVGGGALGLILGTWLARAALVGYTNAGKSTLMRALTGRRWRRASICRRGRRRGSRRRCAISYAPGKTPRRTWSAPAIA